MNNDILALKYRPTSLAQLVGQESVISTLTNAFKDKNLYQCYIFSGAFGTGKTTCARILAAMENCEAGPTLNPCGKCQMCKDIFSGESLDIKEINAASANGIDDVRNIDDFISVRPLLARTKYVIMDEFHAMSRQAVESALKIFEEPPKGVRFVLCTTDLHKIKGTIQSRCMPFRFLKVHWQQITEHLQSICNKEKITAEVGALKVASKLADGSVRNALRNLQLMINYAGLGNTISAEVAQKALGAVLDVNWFALIDAITAKDVPTAMKIIQRILNQGVDVEQILSGLTDHLRNLMILTSCRKVDELTFFAQEEKQRYEHQIKNVTIDLIIDMISLLYEIHRGIAVNINPQILLESYIIKSIKSHVSIERAKKQND